MKFEKEGQEREGSCKRKKGKTTDREREVGETHCIQIEGEMHKENTLLRSYLAPTTPPLSALIRRLYCVYLLHTGKKD